MIEYTSTALTITRKVADFPFIADSVYQATRNDANPPKFFGFMFDEDYDDELCVDIVAREVHWYLLGTKVEAEYPEGHFPQVYNLSLSNLPVAEPEKKDFIVDVYIDLEITRFPRGFRGDNRKLVRCVLAKV